MKMKQIIDSLNIIKETYKEVIITNNFESNQNAISWPNYRPGIFKNFYSKEYEYIIRNRQYSFLLKDKMGCIQFYYEFNEDNIKKIKMAYYPYPIELREDEDDLENYISEAGDDTLIEYYYDIWEILNHEFELDLNNQEFKSILEKSNKLGNNESLENILLAKFDTKYKLTNSSHFRIDYCSDVDTHNKCEIQVGAINQIRIPLNKIISPVIFFDFIIKNITIRQGYHKSLITKKSYKELFDFHRSIKMEIKDFNEINIFVI